MQGLVAVNDAAAVMHRYYQLLNSDDIATCLKNRQQSGSSSSSSSLDTKRLWGLPAVMLLRVANTLVQQCHAKHQATVEFLAAIKAECNQDNLAGLHPEMPSIIMNSIMPSMDIVISLLQPVGEALQHTPLWQATDHRSDLDRDLHRDLDHGTDLDLVDDTKHPSDQRSQPSGPSSTTAASKEYQQRQQQWKKQQQKQLKLLRHTAEGILKDCAAIGKMGQRQASRRSRIQTLAVERVVQEAVALHSELQGFMSSVLAGYPVPFCCNSPGCLNLSQLSEYQLVSGKGCVCGGCKVARYCNRECQKRHWKLHKQMCQQMRVVES